jgi:CRP-like cAMP-binding protein
MNLSLLDKAFFLKKTQFFGALDLDLLLILAEKAEPISFKKGGIIFSSQSETHRMYLIVDGEVIVEYQKDPSLTLRRGDCFGDEALFSQKTHSYKASCQCNTVLLILLRSHILSLIEQSPAFACSLLEIYTDKVPFRHRVL